jgi:tRNA(fMet)-specific endonuclease VapC
VIYVLDTTIASALMRSQPAASRRLLEQPRESVVIPQPAVAEIAYGIALLPASRRRRELEAALAIVLRDVSRAPWTDDVSRRFGEIKADLERRGERVEDFDLAIAAHALALDATVATRNVRHFARIRGLSVEDWTAARQNEPP